MDASSDFCWKEKWFHAVGSCGGFDSICKVAAANIPSSLIVAESRLVLTYPAEQLVKKNASQPRLKPESSELQSDTCVYQVSY